LYLKHDVSEMIISSSSGGIYSVWPNRQTPATTPIGFIKPTLHNPPMGVNPIGVVAGTRR
jgi:hypothetical protein